MAVQEPVGGDCGKQQVAAVQPKKKQFKKKTGGGSGASSGNGGVLSHAEQARVGSGLCFKHFCYEARATGCTKPCNWSGNYSSRGGLTPSPLGSWSTSTTS